MATAGTIVLFLSLVLASLVGYGWAQVDTYVTYCDSYCDKNGYYQNGLSCQNYCCGNSTYRYCCSDIYLDISDAFDDVSSCSCSQSDCYATPIWEYLLYFFAPLAVFTIIAVCCCQCCGKTFCKKCNKTTGNATASHRIASDASIESIVTLPAAVDHNASLHFGHDFTSSFDPPSYETVTQDLPKYEDIFNESAGYNGPYEMTVESTQDLCTPPGEYDEVVTSPPTECTDNDSPPPTYTPL